MYRITQVILQLKEILIEGRSVGKINLYSYLGPKQLSLLDNFGKGLVENVELGWMSMLGRPLLWMLLRINNIFENFGISIITLTLLVKVITFPLTQKSMTSMQKMKKLSSEVKFLQKKYAHDKTLFNQKQLDLYT